MKSTLSISDAVILELARKQGKLTVLKENDHLLRRFGQVDLFQLNDGEKIAVKRENADEVWSVISGRAVFELEDQRKDSPTHAVVEVVPLMGESPVALLVPFGVACNVTCEVGGSLVRITTHEDGASFGDVVP